VSTPDALAYPLPARHGTARSGHFDRDLAPALNGFARPDAVEIDVIAR